MSSSSCATRISSGAILKKRANAATERPERFMKVWGLSSQTVCPCTVVRAAMPCQALSCTSETRSESASASIHQKPALWRVSVYSGPGFPRPTNSLIMVG